MIKAVISEMETKMKGTIEATKRDFQAVRTGRANAGILDKITVDYYGTATALNQLANVSTPDARTIAIQPWDKSVMGAIEKAILKSDLGLNPVNDGTLIRIPIPQLNEERRKDLVKMVKKEAEEKRVVIRNVRRDANDKVKALEKNGTVSEDDSKRGSDEVQKVTDKYIAEVDALLALKEKEIMEV